MVFIHHGRRSSFEKTKRCLSSYLFSSYDPPSESVKRMEHVYRVHGKYCKRITAIDSLHQKNKGTDRSYMEIVRNSVWMA